MEHALPALRPASFPARTTLTRGDRAVLLAVAEAMFSQDGEVPAARLDAQLDEVDAYVSAASKPLRAGLRLALFVMRIAPVLLLVRLCTLERLAVDARVHVLSRLERSPLANLSLAFVGWRAILTFIVYEHPDELRALGYSSERRRHARGLPMLPATVAPEESGVRIANPDSEDALPVAAPDSRPELSREVA